MDSSRISRIEKARRYAAEARERVVLYNFNATVRGDNDSHQVTFDNGQWKCNCHYFETHGDCTHTLTMERVLNGMIAQALPSAA